MKALRIVLASSVSVYVLLLGNTAAAQVPAVPETPPTTSVAAEQDQSSPDNNRDGSDEILVTARRTSERLIDVPVAVTALSRETLFRNNITSLSRVAEIVPFVTLSPVQAGAGGLFAIRGIGSPPADPGIQQTVLINIDNVMIGRGRATSAGLFDVAQIEVLKGPQALFYGKNSPAGVISVITADPGDRLAGFVRAGYEFNADERYMEGAIGGPVTDTLKVRVAARYSFMEGYLDNRAKPTPYPCSPTTGCTTFAPYIAAGAISPGANPQRLPHGTDVGARLTAIWSPASNFEAKLKYTFGHNQVTNFYTPWCGRSIQNPTTLGFVDLQSDCKLDTSFAVSAFPSVLTANFANSNSGVPYNDAKTHIASLNLNWEINDDLSLSAITGYYNLNSANSFVLNGTSIAASYIVALERSSAISEEIRISSKFDGSVNFVLGGLVDRTNQFNTSSAAIGPRPVDPATGRYYAFDRESKFIAKSYSGFGQLRWDILDQLEFAGGVRYTRETRDSSRDGNTYVHPSFTAALAPAGVFLERSLTNSNWSPESTLTWHPSENQTIYGAFKAGFKPGGFSYPTILNRTFTPTNTTFKPERSKGFEVGYKAQLLNRRLVVQAAAYTTTFSDQQVSTFNQSTNSYIVGNAAKARVKGVELQATMAPFQGLQLRGAIGYNDAYYASYPEAPCYGGQPVGPEGCFVSPSRPPGSTPSVRNLTGHQLSRAPKWQGNAGLTYVTPISTGWNAEFNGDAFYSSSYLTNDNLDPFTLHDSYWKLNAGISVATEDDKWKLSFIARNLTDKFVARYTNDSFGGIPGVYSAVTERPREFVIEGRFSF